MKIVQMFEECRIIIWEWIETEGGTTHNLKMNSLNTVGLLQSQKEANKYNKDRLYIAISMVIKSVMTTYLYNIWH